MGASRPWAEAGYRVAGVLVVLLVAALGVAVLPSGAAVPASVAGFVMPAAPPVDTARAAVPDAVGPRVAFTAGRDAIATVSVTYPFDEGAPDVAATDPFVPPATPAPVHEGQLSSNTVSTGGDSPTDAMEAQAFVSTRDDPRGEVYVIVRGSPTAPSIPVRITCDNTAVESHPVISPDGTRLVYATNASGVFRLRLVMLDPNLGALGQKAACPSTVYDLPGAPSGADTWPTWLSDQWVAFSSTRSDPLGDIWAQYVGPATPPQPGRAAIRLTTGRAAETQPASIDLDADQQGRLTVLTFTTTQYRADGSIGAMHLLLSPSDLNTGEPSDLNTGENPEEVLTVVKGVYSPWTDLGVPPQSSEGVWVSDDGSFAARLAFTTQDQDPYGDVVAVSVPADAAEGGQQLALPLPSGGSDDITDIADVPGRAETHPAWLPDPADETSSDSLRVSYTERTPSATVTDVRAADGTGRRTIAKETWDSGDGVTGPLDESTPAYSPDGTRLAYSRIGPGVQGREIVVSDASGGAPVALDRSRLPDAFDSEPAWSPDGSRIAFVRTYVCGEVCPVQGSKVWIGEVATHQARLVTADPTGTIAWDQHPSWSPDGTRIVIARTLQGLPDLTAKFAATSLSIVTGAPRDVDLTVTNRGLGVANGVRVLPGPSGNLFTVEVFPMCQQFCDVDIAAGSSYTWTARVTGTNTGTGSLTIEAAVSGQPSEVVADNNAASVSVTVKDPQIGLRAGAGDASAAWFPSQPQPFGDAGSHMVQPITARALPATVSRARVAEARAVPASVLPAVIREVPAAPPAEDASTLWVLDAATGTAHELTADAPETCECVRTIEGRSPAWSPDGMRIAYEQHGSVRLLELADRRGAAIAVTNEVPHVQMVTGFTQEYEQEIGLATTIGTPTPSRATISVAQDPAWSPDGAWIVLSGQPAGLADNRGIYRIRPKGTTLTVVAQEAGPETEPAWQPWASLAVTLTTTPASIGIGGQATLTATVTNPGPGTSAGTVLTVTLPAGLTPGKPPSGCVSAAVTAGALITCTLGSMRPKAPTSPTTGLVPATATVLIPVTGIVLGLHTVTAAVGSGSPDDLASDNEATTMITVIPALPPETDTSVTVALAPNPGYVGGTGTLTVVVANSATGTATDSTVTIILPTRPLATPSATASATPGGVRTAPSTSTATPTAPPGAVELVGTPECFTGTPCDLGQIAPGTTRTLTATVRFATAGTSTITASVATGTVIDSDLANNSTSVPLVILQPVIRLLQPVADPGSVVLAAGSDFPPGAQVVLVWDVGVNVRPVPLTVAADGTIRASQILIFRRDQLGSRSLVATATQDGLFGPVQDSMMVAPRTVAPPAHFASRS